MEVICWVFVMVEFRMLVVLNTFGKFLCVLVVSLKSTLPCYFKCDTILFS